jgi:predicted TIM-barrel fold metal-dependent hydrolase
MRRMMVLALALTAACASGPVTLETVGLIDAHLHALTDTPPLVELLQRLDARALNICVVDRYDAGYEKAAPQHEVARALFRSSRGRVAWASTFEDGDFEAPDFARRTVADLERTFADGAVGIKIYKSIGMELRRKDGAFLMPDDPVFDPIWELLESRGKTLFTHLAEPAAAWEPLDQKSPHYGYYKAVPAWHVHGRPGQPPKRAILEARDRLLARRPKLRVVGVHLGSMEDDVDEIARRLDLYPNFAVDTGARVFDLMIQPRQKVRDFMIRYADRVLYGSDQGIMPGGDLARAAARLAEEWRRDWRYFATEEKFDVRGRTIEGLGLPPSVVRKIFRDNALRWIPGLEGS